MKLILHPGHAKCGSTSIQRWLQLNREELRRNGIVVPDSKLTLRHDNPENPRDTINTYEYLSAILKDRNEKGLAHDLALLLEGAQQLGDTVILSEEFLTDERLMNQQSLIHNTLHDAFDSIQVLYYIRRQDDFILSAWQQWGHKIGRTLQDEIEDSLLRHQPNYLANMRYLESIYGASNIFVRPFDKEFLVGGDLIKDFCHYSGLKWHQYEPLSEIKTGV